MHGTWNVILHTKDNAQFHYLQCDADVNCSLVPVLLTKMRGLLALATMECLMDAKMI